MHVCGCRSSASILETATRLITNSESSRTVGGLDPLRLAPTKPRGPAVRVVSASSCGEEAVFVRKEIQRLLNEALPLGQEPPSESPTQDPSHKLLAQGTGRDAGASSAASVRPRDLAVLYRAKILAITVERELLAHGIPYIVVGKLSLAERKDPKTLLAYLRLLANPLDSLALARVINEPPRGVGPTAQKTLEDWAKGRSQTLAQALFETGTQLPGKEELPLKEPARKGIQSLCGVLHSARKAIAREHPGELLCKVVRDTGFRAHVSKGAQAHGGAGQGEGEAPSPEPEEGSLEAEKKRKQEERVQVWWASGKPAHPRFFLGFFCWFMVHGSEGRLSPLPYSSPPLFFSLLFAMKFLWQLCCLDSECSRSQNGRLLSGALDRTCCGHFCHGSDGP